MWNMDIIDMEYDITYNTQLTYGIYMNIPTYTALISVYFFKPLTISGIHIQDQPQNQPQR